MPDIYEKFDQNISIAGSDEVSTDNIEERNEYPEVIDNDRDSLSSGQDVLKTTVDFFQVHNHKSEFGQTSGLFSLYDPDNPDRQLFDVIEQEAITLGSAPMKYYRLNHRAQALDPLYHEALAGRRDAYQWPITVHGYYEDPSPMQELTKYGINQPETIDVFFNYNDLLNKLGKKIEKGDLFMTYDQKLWEVMSSLIIDESLWRAQHNNVKLVRAQPAGYYLPDVGKVDTRAKKAGETCP
jgi:hypothetical protein